MKLFTILLIFITGLLFFSCEDVINVTLKTAPPKLVVFASIEWQKGSVGNNQKVKLTTSTAYFDSVIPTVSGATVYITNSKNIKFNFTEKTNTGEYLCTNFIPEINETYILTVIAKGETYKATESLKSVSPITKITQKDQGGIFGEDIEIKTFFNDPRDTDNYYIFKTKANVFSNPEYDIFDDRFTQGNENFGIYTNEDIKAGDNLDIILFGISKRYFEYMRKLTTIAGSSSGGPFATPPASVRGNIVNQTNSKNFALGYFNASETDYRNYVIK
jgi:uncharacterized Zn-finger protein